MARHIKIGLVILVVAFLVSFGFFVDVVGRIQSMVKDRETEENPFHAQAPPLYAPTDPAITVKLFFPAAAGDTALGVEDGTVFKSSEVINQVKQILKELEAGPKTPELRKALPKDAKVQDVFVSGDGVAFVNFSDTISTNHPGGILNEQATIYSIVNSLTYNLTEIQQVKILVGGAERETLAGHCLLLLPLHMDLSISSLPARHDAN